MPVITRRTVTIDELPDVMKRLNLHLTPLEVLEHRRKLSAEADKIVDGMEAWFILGG
jgi:hypothetical protein